MPKLPTSTQIGRQFCPACGWQIDTATAMKDGDTPDAGDISLCLNCGQPAIFDTLLQLRLMTRSEWEECPEETKRMIAVAVMFCEDVRGPLEPRPKPS
jgi:hypothetical protein